MPDNGEERMLEIKTRKLERASSQRLRGVPVHRIAGDFDVSKMKLPFPIFGCLCVQDSPENPCPCTDFVLWMPTFPKAVTRTGQKNADGKEIFEFVLERDAVVYVDVQVPIQPAVLERVARQIRRVRRGSVVVGPSSRIRSDVGGYREGERPIAKSAPDKGWLGLAFGAGWAVGTVLDDLLGSNEGSNDNLSDDIGDWAAENFPAPDWMKDVF
jgi:hypothetical protein